MMPGIADSDLTLPGTEGRGGGERGRREERGGREGELPQDPAGQMCSLTTNHIHWLVRGKRTSAIDRGSSYLDQVCGEEQRNRDGEAGLIGYDGWEGGCVWREGGAILDSIVSDGTILGEAGGGSPGHFNHQRARG